MQVLASYGVFVVKSDQFSVDIEQISTEAETVLETFLNLWQVHIQSASMQAKKYHSTLMSTLAASMIKWLDQIVTETAGCDSFIQHLLRCTERLVNLIPDKAQLREAIVKKFRLVVANAWLKIGDYEAASKSIEQCCSMINQGEKDELKVYFLAFKMHC